MDAKLDYITRVFQKTSLKRYEHYVITRLWYQLDDDEIKLVPQQYVNRNNKQYALTDIFFPQIGLHIEVNEPAHYNSVERINTDNKRRDEIIDKTSHWVKTIDCCKDKKGIDAQIDSIVEIIKNRIKQQKLSNSFNIWNPENEFKPSYFKSKGFIDCNEEVNIRTADDICELFDVSPQKIKRGFLRKGAIEHPKINDILIWWPFENNRSGGWNNSINTDKNEILEKNSNLEKQQGHTWHNIEVEKRKRRLVFYKHKDDLGFQFYKFVGLFSLDMEKTKEYNGVFWKKIEDRFSL